MKKLLSILAVVGLSATAGATVVACGTNDNKPKVKEITEFLIEDKLKLGEFNEAAEAMTQAWIVIGDIPELVGKVKLDDPESDKIHVSVKEGENSLTGETDFTFTVKPAKKDINQLLEGKLNLGSVDSPKDATTAANNVIKSIPELVGKVDSGVPTNNKIHVSVNQAGQDTLTGETDFTFTVKPPVRDLSEVIPTDKLLLDSVIKDADATVEAKDVIKELGLSGKVKLDLPDNGKIVATANDSSLKGSVKFTYLIATSDNLDVGVVNHPSTIIVNKEIGVQVTLYNKDTSGVIHHFKHSKNIEQLPQNPNGDLRMWPFKLNEVGPAWVTVWIEGNEKGIPTTLPTTVNFIILPAE